MAGTNLFVFNNNNIAIDRTYFLLFYYLSVVNFTIMKGSTLLRSWFITYYISGILIPLMIIFGFIFNRFNILNMILGILTFIFQFTMFLGLKLRDRKILFMYSTIILTIVHFCTFIYFLYVTITLTKTIRSDLENAIFSNHSKIKYDMQIKICK